jgi:O-antigen/teichoic acid export membrane protein
VAAGPLLSLLGRHYAEGGVTPLRILVLAWIPLTFVHCYFASARARRRLREALAVGVASAVLSITAAAVAGVSGGLTAMAFAWLGVQTATGLWAAVRLRAAPTVSATAS